MAHTEDQDRGPATATTNHEEHTTNDQGRQGRQGRRPAVGRRCDRRRHIALV